MKYCKYVGYIIYRLYEEKIIYYYYHLEGVKSMFQCYFRFF